ncbi:MAG: glutathione S-transferase C-terminal domain-containing protein [Hyphomicrobium sp.]
MASQRGGAGDCPIGIGGDALRLSSLARELPHGVACTLPTKHASSRPAVELDIHRIITIWRNCRTRFGSGGPFLFGQFSAADAMYAPVASRFRTYVDDLTRYGGDGSARAYVEATIFAMPEIAEWTEGARAEMAGAD